MFGYSIGNSILRARERSWEQYRTDCEARIAIYENDYHAILKDFIRRISSPEAWGIWSTRRIFHEIDNVCKDVIDKTTLLYTRPALRGFESTIGDETTMDEAFEAILKSNFVGSYDLTMDRALKMALIGVGSFVRPFVRVDDPTRISLQTIYVSQVIQVETNDYDELTGIHYLLANTSDSRNAYKEYVWDITPDARLMQKATGGLISEPGVVELKDKKVVVETSAIGAAYPYRVNGKFYMPITPVSIESTPGILFNQCLGNDIMWGTMLASWYSIQKEWIIRAQSHKQFSITGAKAESLGDKMIDPTTPLIFPGISADELKVEVFDLRTDPSHIDVAIDKIFERLLTRRGQSLERFRETAQRQTAEAQKIQKEGENRYQLHLANQMRPIEERILESFRVVWNTHNSQTIGDGVPYFDPADPYSSDPWSNWLEKKEAVGLDVMNVVDLIMDLDPDLTQEQAKTQLELNRSINKRQKSPFSGGLAQNLAAVTPPANQTTQNPAVTPPLEDENEQKR